MEKKSKKVDKKTNKTKVNTKNNTKTEIKADTKKKSKISIKEKVKKVKENPKQTSYDLYTKLKNSIIENKLFVIYALLNTINGLLLRVFTMGTNNIFAIDAFLSDLGFVLLLGSFCYFFKEKGKFIYLLIITIFLSAICVLNSAYYTFYDSFSSISLISTARFITDVGDAVVENVLQPKDLIYALMPIIFIVLRMTYKRKESYINSKFANKDKKAFKNTLIVTAICEVIFCLTLSGTDLSRLTKQWNREYVVKKFGIYTYHVNDLVKSLEPKFAALFGYDSALKEFNEYYADVKAPTSNEYTGIFEGKNIISIHGESIQNFLIGLTINGQEVTPNLNKLAAKSMYFDNFYTQVSVGTSSDTEFTLNTSLMPANIGTAFTDYADKEYVSIPKLLKDKGYYSFAMHANKGDYWNRRIMHKNLGYDELIAKDQFEIDEVIGLGLSDASFFKQSIPKLKAIAENHEKYYGTFIMLTNHTPFSETDKYGEFDVSLTATITNEEGVEEEVTFPYMEDTKLGNYFKSAHYADYALGLFLDELEKEGLLDNTVIVFYGDHDARLPRSNYLRLYNYDYENDDILDEENPNYKEFNDYDYELNRKVPFIIWSKEIEKKPQTISYVMGMYDVMPTLGNMFGFYNKYALGHDIFDIKENNIVVFPTGNWVTKDVYYNNQKEESYFISSSIVSSDTIKKNANSIVNNEDIQKNTEYADKLLSVSNNTLVYNLIANSKLETVDEDSVVKGK